MSDTSFAAGVAPRTVSPPPSLPGRSALGLREPGVDDAR
jgi:hypothetical protein